MLLFALFLKGNGVRCAVRAGVDDIRSLLRTLAIHLRKISRIYRDRQPHFMCMCIYV